MTERSGERLLEHPAWGGDTLADEVEAVLAGHLADRLRLHGHPVPAWAALNRVAHGTLDDVRDAAGPLEPDGVERTLARAVLGVARTAEDLAVAQRELRALELRVLGEVMSPRRLVELTCRALYG